MKETKQSILILGCFDTKEENFNFLRQSILSHGNSVICMNTGVMGSTLLFPVDIESDEIAIAAGHTLEQLRQKADRGYAVEIMGIGARNILKKRIEQEKINAIIGMGGGGGTYIALAAMRDLPLGMPKICVSTLATKDLSHQIGMKDVMLIPSVLDIAGLNRISRQIIRNAAAAICGMAKVGIETNEKTNGIIAISMFGNTNACVDKCSKILESKGYEVMVFHANGLGGKAMESMIRDGFFVGILDITTTELADELCGGICSAGPNRLIAAVEMGVPQVLVPGCLDMVNFGRMETVPKEYNSREFYSWAPDVTLMRTNAQENIHLAQIITEKLSQATAPTSVLLPLKGLSQVDAEGGVFYHPEINRVLFDTIKQHCAAHVDVVEVDMHINERSFAEMAVNILFGNIEKNNKKQKSIP